LIVAVKVAKALQAQDKLIGKNASIQFRHYILLTNTNRIQSMIFRKSKWVRLNLDKTKVPVNTGDQISFSLVKKRRTNSKRKHFADSSSLWKKTRRPVQA
jgi:hypothetical protein